MAGYRNSKPVQQHPAAGTAPTERPEEGPVHKIKMP